MLHDSEVECGLFALLGEQACFWKVSVLCRD